MGMEYGAIRALAEVDYTVAPGEIVGLIGDNGAGKSTLVKIIAGNFPPTHGTMHFDGREVRFRGPEDARAFPRQTARPGRPCSSPARNTPAGVPPPSYFYGQVSGLADGLVIFVSRFDQKFNPAPISLSIRYFGTSYSPTGCDRACSRTIPFY